MYRSIIFLQLEDDFELFSGTGGEGINGFFDSEDEEQLDYLMQWYDIADSEEDVSNVGMWGEDDTLFQSELEDHTLIVNRSFNYGYAGLCEKI